MLQKVPATSVAPTYKLTLPAEVVCEALPHLIEKDFELVDTTGQHVWSVSILPRKNKDKFEYTLQVCLISLQAMYALRALVRRTRNRARLMV